MIWKNAMKYPVLVVGIVLFTLFITNPKTKEYWQKHTKRFIPNSCTAIKSRIEKQAPDNWEIECPGTVRLVLKVHFNIDVKDQDTLRPALYREMANTYVKLANLSNPETMAWIKIVEIDIVYESGKIHSVSDGQALVELRSKRTQRDIANHLKLTVKVKEL